MLACVSSVRERARTSSSSAAAWIAPPASTSRSTASAKRSGWLSASSSCSARTSTACSEAMSRASVSGRGVAPAAQARQAGRALDLLVAQLVRLATTSDAAACTMSLISSGSSRAMRSVGRSLISSSEARSIRSDEPRLGELLPRSIEAREGASDWCHSAGSRSSRTSVHSFDRTPEDGGWSRANDGKMPDMADLIPIEQRARRVLGGACARSPRRTCRWPTRPRPRAGRGRDERDRRAALRPLRDGRLRRRRRAGGRAARDRTSRAPAIRRAERVEPGTAIRISTGAMVPEGATAVVPIERVRARSADGPGRRGPRMRRRVGPTSRTPRQATHPPPRRGRARGRSC